MLLSYSVIFDSSLGTLVRSGEDSADHHYIASKVILKHAHFSRILPIRFCKSEVLLNPIWLSKSIAPTLFFSSSSYYVWRRKKEWAYWEVFCTLRDANTPCLASYL